MRRRYIKDKAKSEGHLKRWYKLAIQPVLEYIVQDVFLVFRLNRFMKHDLTRGLNHLARGLNFTLYL